MFNGFSDSMHVVIYCSASVNLRMLLDSVSKTLSFFYLCQRGCGFIHTCLLAGLCKNYSSNLHKIRWKVARGLWKIVLDFGGNVNHITLMLG